MSFQELANIKNSTKKATSFQGKDQQRGSLLINSSFNIGNQDKMFKKQITEEVLKKVSQTIVSLHSNLVPKTQNIQIYRDLTADEQNMLKLVQQNKLIHTILAGVLAIDSCLKYIHRQQTYVISSLLKATTICLGNYKKVEEEFLTLSSGKVSQNFLKFFDSLKLIISDIHKIPAAKIKKNQLQKHNQFICKAKMNAELQNLQNREQNILFSLLAQQNNSLRIKIKQMQKQMAAVQRQKQQILRSFKSIQSLDKKKRDSQNFLTQTGSESLKASQEDILIRELKDQIIQKNQIIVKMNDQFSAQMQKYQKVFKRLQEQNRLLKKYNDIDTAYILQELEYEIQILRQQKRNDKRILSQIFAKMDRMSWNKNQCNLSSFQNSSFKQRPKYEIRISPSSRLGQARNYQTKRSRYPSISPNNKQQRVFNRYFSPNFQIRDKLDGQSVNDLQARVSRRQSYMKQKRENSPRFGYVQRQNNYDNLRQRASRSKLQKQKNSMNFPLRPKQQRQQMRKSQTKFNGLRNVSDLEEKIELNKLKKQIRRSKFLNQQIAYM